MACLDTSFMIDLLAAEEDAQEVMEAIDDQPGRHPAYVPIRRKAVVLGHSKNHNFRNPDFGRV